MLGGLYGLESFKRNNHYANKYEVDASGERCF